MAGICYRTLTLNVTPGEETDAMLRCPADGYYYIVGKTSQRIYKIDPVTFAIAAQTDNSIYLVPNWAQLFYEPTFGYIWTRIIHFDPVFFVWVPQPKLDRATMLPAGPAGGASAYMYGTSCRNSSTGHLYCAGGSNVARIDAATDTVTHHTPITNYHTWRLAEGALYYAATDMVLMPCNWGGTGFPWNCYAGVIAAQGTDLNVWNGGPGIDKMGFCADELAGELWPAWQSTYLPGQYSQMGGIAYITPLNRCVVGWEHTLAWIDMNITSTVGVFTGVYTVDLGGFMVDCIYHTDGLLYCHLHNGNVVVWNPNTDSITDTYTGFQPVVAYPAGNYQGSYSRMAFDATGTHLYVSSYGVTNVF